MSRRPRQRIEAAAAAVGHAFARPELLAEALTHPSAQGQGRTYERLEFLGDRVLGLVIADMLSAAFPAENEGALAKRLAHLVRQQALARVGAQLELGRWLEMSKGEEEAGGRDNPTLLADAIEAVIGALYLDAGLAAAEAFVRHHWTPLMEESARPPQDAKTRLQEWAQAVGRALPRYTTVRVEGPSHAPRFIVEVDVEGCAPRTGTGPSKRAAEQAAAAALLGAVAAAQGETQ